MRSFGFLVFVFMTFVCWGIYGPTLHLGQEGMGAEGQKSSLRPFVCVGIAYFLIAVIYPLVVLFTKGEKGKWTSFGFVWSFVAGAVGAVGALGIIMAFKFGGKPVYVMPLVFGCAPVVNTIVTMLMSRTAKQASMLFYLGVLIVAVGAAGVMYFKPMKTDKPNVETAMVLHAQDSAEVPEVDGTVGSTSSDEKKDSKYWLVACSVAVTALCWGAYGPVLHRGQAQMDGSKLRPFLCVGLAYFAIAVVIPFFLMSSFPEPGPESGSLWFNSGMTWSLLAGGAGAIGALGIIYAFNFGGKPIFVMPLVFGIAPVVNTFTEIVSKQLYGQVSQMFYLSLLLVILGAMMVLVCAPRGKKPAAKPAAS
ncbi:hypothetical protein OAG68_02420 [bacterium]|nr:hypothetical protein [bacterium]